MHRTRVCPPDQNGAITEPSGSLRIFRVIRTRAPSVERVHARKFGVDGDVCSSSQDAAYAAFRLLRVFLHSHGGEHCLPPTLKAGVAYARLKLPVPVPMASTRGEVAEARQSISDELGTMVELPVPSSYTLQTCNVETQIPHRLMRPPCDLEILIPALDEARRLPATLKRTVHYLEKQQYSSCVVVIDNGSVDKTSDLATEHWSDIVPVRLIGCAQIGKGAAVRRGILTSSARFVGYMDADLATPIETLDIVMPLLSDFHAVVGSRHVAGAELARRQPFLRVITGLLFRTATHWILPGLADTQCGFKFFSGDVARAVARHLSIDGFAFDLELLKSVIEFGIPVKEIPVVWSNVDGSTLRTMRDGLRALGDVLSLARRRLG